MLRTNSKKAIENIKNYIVANADGTNYNIDFVSMRYKDLCEFILTEFRKEYRIGYELKKSEQDSFISWCQGLPSVLDTCYYYNRSAVQDLGDILEETEEERNRFTEQQAEEMLTKLIYRELRKNEV